ncbi:NYN domain-containing protein [Phyllobacterium phragmitis]|uniref:NYN domain-containing protein n=1 Tax=Phyllobacterium phragmitis TaxID=2670329 RepID=UPI001305067A|nr:NYN domain-containing protein [Phyllobacterium phragmitis]
MDGSYIDSISTNRQFDFIKFASAMRQNYSVTNFVYFSLVPRYEEIFPKRRLLDWLSYNGYIVREKHAKMPFSQSPTGLRGSLSLEIAISALEACDNTDGFVLATNDSDMCAAIRALQKRTKWVALVGGVADTAPWLDDELRRTADICLPLDPMMKA